MDDGDRSRTYEYKLEPNVVNVRDREDPKSHLDNQDWYDHDFRMMNVL